MSLTRKLLLVLVGIVGLLALGACTREITTIVQEEPQPSNCFECHSDVDLAVVRAQTEWAESRHGEGETVFEGTNASCVRCHANEGFIQFVEDPARLTYTGSTTPTNINCFTCHAPHSSGDFGLRITAPVALLNGESADVGLSNGCIVCHQARRDVNVYVTASNNITIRFGPHHGPQGDLLLGTNGYEYDGFDYTNADMAFHRTSKPEGSRDGEYGCVMCHMIAVNYQVGGHTFKTATVDEESGDTVYNVDACTACHTTYEGEDFDINGVRTEIDGLLAELQVLLEAAGFVDGTGTPLTVSGRPADDAGAIWNFMYIGREDRSHGAHNPDYARALLQSTINYMNSRAPS